MRVLKAFFLRVSTNTNVIYRFDCNFHVDFSIGTSCLVTRTMVLISICCVNGKTRVKIVKKVSEKKGAGIGGEYLESEKREMTLTFLIV